ncbi:M56 family metallopeptidase [Enterococcus nangangensis]|uniref:M56 family metallopeptidase n=1 Tax=Enterococcus nangangensis TaxID=2559926 RepID=UPI0010F6C4C2|nr:M56 family metallopeptidase [Enterococcus nangangensis]
MIFSLSSLLISSLLSCVLILVLRVLLKKTAIYRVVRTDFLNIFCLVIFLRLLFPVELKNTMTLPSRVVLPTLFKVLATTFYVGQFDFSLEELLFVIWIFGSCFYLAKLFVNIFKLKNVVNQIAEYGKPVELELSNRNTSIFITDFVGTPTVLGVFHRYILIPSRKYTAQELEYILLHEKQHIQNRDILKKMVLELLIVAYWWLVPLYFFRKQFNLVLEFSVDKQVTQQLSDSEYFDYAQSLVSVQKKNSLETLSPNIVANFTISEKFTLQKRINFLLEGYENRKTKKSILAICLLLPLVVTSFIFEPYHISEERVVGTETVDMNADTYLLKKQDGTYVLYIDGQDMGIVSDTKDSSLKELKIINEEGK